MGPSVGIVVVNWNEKQILRQCLESFIKKTKYENAEIIVFDNNSKDGSQEMVREEFPNVTLIAHDDNIGFVGGENEAYLQTDHDMYFFLNNDTEALNEGWLSYLVETAMKDERIGIVGPKTFLSEGIHGGGFFGPMGGYRRLSDDPDEFEEIIDVDWVAGAQILIKKEVFEDVGMFDEIYWPAFMEEVDLCYRAKQGGYRVVYDPRAEIRHYQNESVEMDLHKFYIQRRHGIRFSLVNYPLSWLLQWQLKAVQETVGTVLERDGARLRVRDNAAERFKKHLRAYWWNLKDADEILRGRRKRKQSYREKTDMQYWKKNRTYGGE
ncbi:MAG: glycosyltransferase family 2 protein [Halobacteriaceae archaeon]